MKILIIDDDKLAREQLKTIIKSNNIDEAENGLIAINKLKKSYDIIFLDLIMPLSDGFDVLNYIKKKKINTKIIILSSLSNSYTLKRLLLYNIEFFICKPYNKSTVRSTLNHLTYDKQDIEVGHTLTKSGIGMNLKGYDYLREIIKIVIKTNITTINLSKKLYPEVATKFNITANAVERSIRNAIEISFSNNNFEEIERVFKNKIDEKKGKVTNLVYIKTICEYLKNT